jgi:hypothetical protein
MAPYEIFTKRRHPWQHTNQHLKDIGKIRSGGCATGSFAHK